MRIPPEVKPGAKRVSHATINAGRQALKELRRDAITKVPQLGGAGGKGGVAFGVVSSATAATWDNAEDELVPGEVLAWMFKDGKIDREGPTVTLRHWWTAEPVEGSLIGGLAGDVVVMTCGALEGWA
jgi:hypothetical protein